LAEIADGEIEPRLHLPIGVLGEADRARHGDPFEPRGDVDAVAHQIAVALHDVAQMYADAELDAPILGHAGIALHHRILDLDRAAHGVDDATELHQRAVAVRLTTHPLCTAMVGSIRSLRNARSRASVWSSSMPVSRLKPTTSAARIAASFLVSVTRPSATCSLAWRRGFTITSTRRD
jgi:hypothetical protein